MPGELGNCIAGRVANLFNLHGPNFTIDAACASALAAMDATVDGLLAHEFDVAITGGVDRNMGASHVRQVLRDRRAVADRHAAVRGGADGFVMGEGAALFVVKRLADAVARRRPHLRRGPRRGRRERRQGQGHHRPQPGRAALRGGAGLAQRGARRPPSAR